MKMKEAERGRLLGVGGAYLLMWENGGGSPLTPKREASTEYEPSWPGKKFRHTVQDCTMYTFAPPHRMYSMLIILYSRSAGAT
jgi:hypothetical protein